ncbi:hypothetical protein AciX9_1883 [Granulicella tundricola MP5ACTX9]|uniref:Uncharacterized protein n=1 Tax=Granulicella tundricola (strain ATCC BAA-1859 / DSM 23138 / MP5ACTX9) TaxID=1198114 RepID=E8X033_GRATM|nr:hypothetical protein AciX9_1883 [Granulicella tundricola MP5ACTX9]
MLGWPTFPRTSRSLSFIPISTSMISLRLIRLEGACLATALILLLAYLMVARRINLKGLLGSGSGFAGLKLERVLLLVVTVVVSLKYAIDLVTDGSGTMPGIGLWWLILFGASCAVYLIGTWLRVARGR